MKTYVIEVIFGKSLTKKIFIAKAMNGVEAARIIQEKHNPTYLSVLGTLQPLINSEESSENAS